MGDLLGTSVVAAAAVRGRAFLMQILLSPSTSHVAIDERVQRELTRFRFVYLSSPVRRLICLCKTEERWTGQAGGCEATYVTRERVKGRIHHGRPSQALSSRWSLAPGERGRRQVRARKKSRARPAAESPTCHVG